MSRIPICKQVPCQRLLPLVFVPADPAGLQQIIPEVVGDLHLVYIAVLQSLFLEEHLPDGLEDDLHIPEDRDVLDVFQIGSQLAVPTDGIAASRLRETGKTRADAMALTLFRGHEHHVPHKLRAGTDDRHVALKDVECLGQFV